MRIATLEQYVLVSQHERRIDVFTRPERGHWTIETAKAGESVMLHGKHIRIDAVFG